MKKSINFNYVFLVYDIKEERVNKVFKVCKKYLVHFQKSVFRGKITTSKLMRLKAELNKIINEEEDFIAIIKVLNEESFSEDILGNKPSNGEDLFI